MITLSKQCNVDFLNTIYTMSKILSKKDKKDYVTHLKVNEDKIYATNGKILIACNNIYEWESGYYKIIKATKSCIELYKTDDINYPDIKFFDESFNKSFDRYCKIPSDIPTTAVIDFFLLTGNSYKEKYLSLITYISENWWTVFDYKKDAPLLLKNNQAEIMIMPSYHELPDERDWHSSIVNLIKGEN